MKSLRILSDQKLHFIDLPDIRELGPTEVLVRMAYASICGFDMMMLSGKSSPLLDGVVGHEGSGVIMAVGSEVNADDFLVGDRVTFTNYDSCGVCDACRSNMSNYCFNIKGINGLMTEYLAFDQRLVYRLPENLSLKAGCLIEPLTMAMKTVEKAKLAFGKTVLILGCGSMGQIILKVARRYPVSRIVVVDPHKEKREQALKFGADIVVDSANTNLLSKLLQISGGRGFDAVIEASGSQRSAQLALNVIARGGSLVYLALYGMDFSLEVNLLNLYWKDASINAVFLSNAYFPAAIALAPSLNLEEVITAVYPFEQAIEAFEAKANGCHAKVILEFPK